MRSSLLCGHVRFSLCFKTWLHTTVSFLPIWHLRLNNSFLSMVTKTLLVVQAFNLRRGRKMSLISRSTQQVPGQLGLQSEILFQKENKANFYRSVSVLTFNISWQIHSAVRWQKIAYYFRLSSIMSIKSFKNFSSICKSLHSPVLSTIFKTVWRSKSLTALCENKDKNRLYISITRPKRSSRAVRKKGGRDDLNGRNTLSLLYSCQEDAPQSLWIA